MGCNCGKPSVPASQQFEVIGPDGKSYGPLPEAEARIKATIVNGRLVASKK